MVFVVGMVRAAETQVGAAPKLYLGNKKKPGNRLRAKCGEGQATTFHSFAIRLAGNCPHWIPADIFARHPDETTWKVPHGSLPKYGDPFLDPKLRLYGLGHFMGIPKKNPQFWKTLNPIYLYRPPHILLEAL